MLKQLRNNCLEKIICRRAWLVHHVRRTTCRISDLRRPYNFKVATFYIKCCRYWEKITIRIRRDHKRVHEISGGEGACDVNLYKIRAFFWVPIFWIDELIQKGVFSCYWKQKSRQTTIVWVWLVTWFVHSLAGTRLDLIPYSQWWLSFSQVWFN